jgi:hypothetical protein
MSGGLVSFFVFEESLEWTSDVEDQEAQEKIKSFNLSLSGVSHYLLTFVAYLNHQIILLSSASGVVEIIMTSVNAIKLHMTNPKLRDLTIPFVLSTMASSYYIIFYIYMSYRYDASPTTIGLYLSFNGVMIAFVQGKCHSLSRLIRLLPLVL